MQIRVKSVEILKTGKNAKGPWTLHKVTSLDGTEYTTFDKKVTTLNSEALFEADVELKDGKASFPKVGNIISNPEAPPALLATKQNNGYRGKSPEELELSRYAWSLRYACDLAIAERIKVTEIIDWATSFEGFMKPPAPVTVVPPKKTEPAKAKTQADKDFENLESAAGDPTFNCDALLKWVMGSMKFTDAKTARKWLIDVARIEESRIDEDPEAVKLEVAAVQGWVV